MGDKMYRINDVVLCFLGEDNIPAIGPFFRQKENALDAVNNYLMKMERLGIDSKYNRCSVKFVKQADGRYSLLLINGGQKLETLGNLDELLLKRFRKGLHKKFFVITSFYESDSGDIECLALSEGLGAVLLALDK